MVLQLHVTVAPMATCGDIHAACQTRNGKFSQNRIGTASSLLSHLSSLHSLSLLSLLIPPLLPLPPVPHRLLSLLLAPSLPLPSLLLFPPGLAPLTKRD